jgi:glucose/arabinose dehydrogenase
MNKCYLFLAFLVVCLQVQAQPEISYNVVTNGFTAPVDIVNAGDTRLFVVEQAGKVKIWDGTNTIATPFLDITSITNFSGEMGLLSLAFHPNYANNRYFFVYYNTANGNINLARYRTKETNAQEADPTSGVVLMSIPKPFTNHNGGKLNFGIDGFLYFGIGDGGSGGDPNNYSQNGSSYLGKMLRINVDSFSTPPYYTIPPNNPYIATQTFKEEIIAMGLRNPWRWSFDRQTGDMWIADVGQGALEEVNFTPSTELNNNNYGWRCYEGTQPYNTSSCSIISSYKMPIFEYGHNNATGGYSITGGYVYRGTEYPSLQGYYITSDYISKNNWLIKSNGSGGWLSYQTTNKAPTNIVGFGESNNGTLYAVGANGSLYKIIAVNPLPIKLQNFSGKLIANKHQLSWTVLEQELGDAFVIEQSKNGVNFSEIGKVFVSEEKAFASYSFTSLASTNAAIFYRIKVIGKDGKFSYSSIIKLEATTNEAIKISKLGNKVLVTAVEPIQLVQVINTNAQIVQKQTVNNQKTAFINSFELQKGVLFIQVFQKGHVSTHKFFNE